MSNMNFNNVNNNDSSFQSSYPSYPYPAQAPPGQTGYYQDVSDPDYYPPGYNYGAAGVYVSHPGSSQSSSYAQAPNALAYDYSMTPVSDGSYSIMDDMHMYSPRGEQDPSQYDDGKKGKRRPPRMYTPEQLAHRREQNRKSQRAYRDRKDQRIKELEEQIAAAEKESRDLNSALQALQDEYKSLHSTDGESPKKSD
ncbi:hypothetical protein B0H63DRAFT_196103 [Podospora didyma]|uniref:Putative transcription factor kapC n=1 Tax=Podospora didyma TaxID=330526 RepID=A0AAE0NGJ5_9PEZI|nr:hypothetical protein B0H63DRAFT_196103 [Podospora didyma]